MMPRDSILGDPNSTDLVKRKPDDELPEFDITAMVDLVFMMNIYFLVTFITVALSEVDLPMANHCSPLDADDAVIVTVTGALDGKTTQVYLGNEESGAAITEPEAQEKQLRSYAEQGQAAGKHAVLLKAEKRVRLGDLFRIASASAVEGLKLHVAVHEKDSAK